MTQVLKTPSDAMASTVDISDSGVLRVEARRRLPASGIIWSSDGVVVTAHHVSDVRYPVSRELAARFGHRPFVQAHFRKGDEAAVGPNREGGQRRQARTVEDDRLRQPSPSRATRRRLSLISCSN